MLVLQSMPRWPDPLNLLLKKIFSVTWLTTLI